jgi:WD40 repeat protein
MGIKPNDIIVGFNYQSIKNVSELEHAVSGSSPGDRIVLSIFRLSPTIMTVVGRMGQSPDAGGQEIRKFTGHTAWVNSVGFSPDGQYVVSGSWGSAIHLWDVATGPVNRIVFLTEKTLSAFPYCANDLPNS